MIYHIVYIKHKVFNDFLMVTCVIFILKTVTTTLENKVCFSHRRVCLPFDPKKMKKSRLRIWAKIIDGDKDVEEDSISKVFPFYNYVWNMHGGYTLFFCLYFLLWVFDVDQDIRNMVWFILTVVNE